MPNPEAMKNAAQKREARRAAREANAVKADAQEKEMSILTELQNKAKTDPEAAAALRAKAPEKPPVRKLTKAQRMAEERKAAEAQAEADVRVLSALPEADLDLSKWEARGEKPPLHILNAIAQRNDQAIRDDAREMAQAVGKLVYEQANARDSRGRHLRERRMQQAIARAKASEQE